MSYSSDMRARVRKTGLSLALVQCCRAACRCAEPRQARARRLRTRARMSELYTRRRPPTERHHEFAADDHCKRGMLRGRSSHGVQILPVKVLVLELTVLLDADVNLGSCRRPDGRRHGGTGAHAFARIVSPRSVRRLACPNAHATFPCRPLRHALLARREPGRPENDAKPARQKQCGTGRRLVAESRWPSIEHRACRGRPMTGPVVGWRVACGMACGVSVGREPLLDASECCQSRWTTKASRVTIFGCSGRRRRNGTRSGAASAK